jgi:hypothetical protein
MIANLGKAISILARAEALEENLHASVSAFGAPSECHDSVSKGEVWRARISRRHAEAIARAPLRVIAKEARDRGGVSLNSHNRHYCRAVSASLSEIF